MLLKQNFCYNVSHHNPLCECHASNSQLQNTFLKIYANPLLFWVNPWLNGVCLIPSYFGPVTWVGCKEHTFQSSVGLDLDPEHNIEHSWALSVTWGRWCQLHRLSWGSSEESCAKGRVQSLAQQTFCPRLLNSTIPISLEPQRLPRTEHSWQRHSEESLCN